MSRTLPLLTTGVLSLLFVALAACGGGGEEKATQTPTKPTEASPTEAAAGTPGPSFSGNATATVKVGDKTFTFKNGRCDIGPDDTWLAVNIGQPGGDEYFGLLVGANPSAPEGARPVSGGGEFTDGELILSGIQGDSSFAMGGIGAAAEENKVTVAADLKSGQFEGTTIEGQPISGSFKC